MMRKLNMLILTDHRKHSKENSLYTLAKNMRLHPQCGVLDVATRGEIENVPFFEDHNLQELVVCRIDKNFIYTPDGSGFQNNLKREQLEFYDVIWLRLPPPLSLEFLQFLATLKEERLIINDPLGIHQIGSKAFLLNFPKLCPPMQLCNSAEQIRSFKALFPIILKPLQDYGGKGLVRIDGDIVWKDGERLSFEQFMEQWEAQPVDYLGVRFLKNVNQGDKRIVVAKGEVLGALLRMPAEDSWLCNVAMGGYAVPGIIDEYERHIVETIDPILQKMGIIFYGIDTLVDDDGKRVLSEINATSIGGLPQIAIFQKAPLVERAVDLIWQYILKKKYGSSKGTH